jgi:hypothetical protein
MPGRSVVTGGPVGCYRDARVHSVAMLFEPAGQMLTLCLDPNCFQTACIPPSDPKSEELVDNWDALVASTPLHHADLLSSTRKSM